jgi:hypothetical protein
MIRWDEKDNTFSSLLALDPYPNRVAVNGDSVYVAGQYEGDYGIFRFPIRGGKATNLVPRTGLDAVVSGLVVDDDDVYWLDQLTLHRVSKKGGPDEVLAHRDLPGLERSLRMTSNGVAWLDGTTGAASDAGDLVTSVCVLPRRSTPNR